MYLRGENDYRCINVDSEGEADFVNYSMLNMNGEYAKIIA